MPIVLLLIVVAYLVLRSWVSSNHSPALESPGPSYTVGMSSDDFVKMHLDIMEEQEAGLSASDDYPFWD